MKWPQNLTLASKNVPNNVGKDISVTYLQNDELSLSYIIIFTLYFLRFFDVALPKQMELSTVVSLCFPRPIVNETNEHFLCRYAFRLYNASC